MSSRIAWAAVGVASGAVAVGVAEVVAGLLGGVSVIAAIGAVVIALQPPGAKDLMVALFGTFDKIALEVAVFIGGLVVGAVIGLIARRDRRLGYLGFVGFGLVGIVLLLREPLSDPVVALITVVSAVVAGMVMLSWLSAMLGPEPTADAAAEGRASPPASSVPRRAFLAVAATFLAVGGVLAVIGRVLGGRAPAPSGEPIAIPKPRQTAPPVTAANDFGIEGLSSIIVPNDEFYQIDTRLGTPYLNVDEWSLRIHGMVDREVRLSYTDLLAMPLVERIVTIACVSNEVGGRLVGNAKWTGVSLNSVLDQAGVQEGASQVVGRSFDNWTCGFPTEHLSGAGAHALIALQMNEQPLPTRHGYPARLIVPGLYGYVSATKWLTEIELTTLEAFDAYWVPLGWAKEGPILTQSRVEVPRRGGVVPVGDVVFAGVAWAPTRGISKVQVDVDDTNTWSEAELSQPLSDYSWIQWRVTRSVAVAGTHWVRVRAYDGTGAAQEEGPTPPYPDGARGYHRYPFFTE